MLFRGLATVAVCAGLTAASAGAALAQPVAPYDPTGAVSPDGVYTPPALLSLEGAFAGAVALEADPRIADWAALGGAGDIDALAAAVEDDLRGAAPHPFATHVWAWAQWAAGRLSADTLPPFPEGLEVKLELAAKAFAYERAGHREALAALVPVLLAAPEIDYWAAFEAAYAAYDLNRRAQFREVARRLLVAFPEDFGVAWMADPADETGLAAMTQWLNSNPTVAEAPAGRMIRWRMADRSATWVEAARMTRMWLDVAPGDANALRRLGYQNETGNDHASALAAFRREHDAYPFRDAWKRVGRALVRQEAFDDARALAADSAWRDEPAPRRAAVAAYRLSHMMREAGELGFAREAVLAGLATASNDPDLLFSQAQTASDEGFLDETLETVAPLVAARPAGSVVTELLVKTLNTAKRHREALEAIQQFRDAGGKLTDDILDAYRSALWSLDRSDEAAALWSLAETETPEVLWVRRNLAWVLGQAGRYDEAFERVRELAFSDGSNDWTIARLVEFGQKSGRDVEVSEALSALAARYPFGEGVWLQQAKLAVSAADVWAEASVKAPGLAFPAVAWSRLAREDWSNWRDAERVLSEALERLEANGAEDGQIAAILSQRAYVRDEAVRRGHDDNPQAVAAGLADLDRARELGLELGDYWRSRYFLLMRLGASVERSIAAQRMMDYFPDSDDDLGHLFLAEVGEHFGTSALPFKYVDRIARRRPRASDSLIEAATRHTKWGGSSVVALSLLERAKRWDPEAKVDTQRDRAYADLGAYQRHYEAQYDQSDSIAKSERYIGWFEAARANARKDQPVLKTLDLSAMKVVLIRPDGIEEETHYDPVTGRILYYRLGRAELRIAYSADHYLTAVQAGSGRRVEFTYGPTSADGLNRRIATMSRTDGPPLAFRYNDIGKPVMIEIEGLGRLDVAYDSDGEITKVSSVAYGEDGETEGDAGLSIEVTQAFQSMLALVEVVRDIGSDSFNALSVEDPELDALREKFEGTDGDAAYDAMLDLTRALIGKVAEHPDHREQAESLLNEIYFDAAYSEFGFEPVTTESGVYVDFDDPDALPVNRQHSKSDADLAAEREVWTLEVARRTARGIEAVRLWRALAMATKPEGLPRESWIEWTGMRDWALAQDADAAAVGEALARLRDDMAGGSIRALSNAGWLRTSALSNPGFWRTHALTEVLPRALLKGARTSAVLVRANGDVVVGSNRGFSVLRRGFWEWFGFDIGAGRYVRTLDYGELDANSAVTSLAEDAQGRLWLGLRNGLAMIADDYELKPTLWRSGANGLIEGGFETLAVNGAQLAAGGDGGLTVVDLDSLSARIADASPVERLRPSGTGWLVAGRNGLWLYQRIGRVDLTDFRVTDAYHDAEAQVLYTIQGDTVLSGHWDGETALAAPLTPLPEQETIAATAPPFGFALMPVFDGEMALAVLTDQGASVYREGGFEHMSVPDTDRREAIRAVAGRDGRLFMLTGRGVSAVERGQASYSLGGRVHDLLTDASLGVTYVAWGDRIEVVDHTAERPVPEWFAGVSARVMAIAPDGALITHDGLTVLRFDRGSTESRELFYADQTVPQDRNASQIEHILAASDGTIWVTAGASLYRWREGEEVEELSIYKDMDAFPANSDMLSGVFEAVDGRILLVASNEGHRSYRRAGLRGGLFEYADGAFQRASDDITGSWFVTSYTALGDGRAVAGTTGGFAVHDGERLAEFDLSEDASYSALKDRRPALYLGTDGARLGEDLWLFGTASGVVGLRGGIWFNPDRLNWMLPGQEFASYGSRVVHAIETDPKGRVYMATDWGLTIYDPLGAGAESFLISERRSDFAFSALEQTRMREVNAILLDALPPDSKAGKLAEMFRLNRKKLAELESQLDEAEMLGPAAAAKLDKLTLRARQRDLALLAKLERDEPALFDMLQLNPLDLQAVGRRLPDGITVAQYLPTESVLYINLVTNQGAEVRQVRVTAAELEKKTRLAVSLMAAQARGVRRGFDLGGGTQAVATVSEGTDHAGQDPVLNNALAWLYDQLLRPIEHEIEADGTLVASPSGVLSYLPFGALIRDASGPEPQFAVQRFRFAIAPSLYAVDMLADAAPSLAFSHVVFGDTDGSLPEARAEAEGIAEVLAPDLVELRLGDAATYDELLSYSGEARFVHLAMHGKLNHESPRNSYLLLAEGRRMSIPQIMTLPLSETDLVFLSACESGLGASGLEHRTIAHAFAHAGAPAVIATLWQVDDAATRDLALAFYEAKIVGQDNAAALGQAQLAMIEGGGAHALPGYWAGLGLFGKP